MQATQVDFPQATRKERKRASDWGGCATYARKMDDTFDGRNPAPVDMVNVPLFTGFYTSQVVQEFFHQQYEGLLISGSLVKYLSLLVSFWKDLDMI